MYSCVNTFKEYESFEIGNANAHFLKMEHYSDILRYSCSKIKKLIQELITSNPKRLVSDVFIGATRFFARSLQP